MTKKNVTGIVEKCGAYPLKEPKTFTFQGKKITNTHRLSLKLQDEDSWFSFGETESDGFFVKDDDGKYQVLGPGSEILIKYQQNGEFRNAKKSDITVLNFVVGEKYEKGSQGSSSSAGSSRGNSKSSGSGTGSTASSSFVNAAEVGQCLNLAVQVRGLSAEELLDEVKVQDVIAWYKEVRALFMKKYPDVKAGEYFVQEPEEEVEAPFDPDNEEI